ncbi:tail fiber domain-containing protein [Acinetobacter sp. ABJ_C5_2]|uniref:tail fiber domain-containing protein n=1 Tax=Acinetobacter sp. ABJ_C5_2 TaxID=3376992 RepID=UPI0037CA4B0C
MSSKIQTPYPLFSDIDGHPLDAGYIYIGEAGKNPEVYPIPVFWDEDLSIPAAQPIRTRNGYLSYYGRAGKLYVSGDQCSITVRNKKRSLIYTDLNADLAFTQSNFNEKLRNLTTNVESISALLLLERWQGRSAYVKSYYNGLGKGGGLFIYDSSRSSENDGGGCINGWVRELENNTVNPYMFGAYGLVSDSAVTDPASHDDSSALTSSIKYAIASKALLDGENGIYGCHSVELDSNFTFKNANLVCNKFDTDLISVLECTSYNDDPRWIENVYLENIHIDGKRELHTAIKSSTTQEDGGRSGFRFIRPINGLTMINCSGKNCAADGIILFPHGNQSAINNSIKNVRISNSQFNGNRRHGGSSNSVNGMILENVICNGNGLDIDPNAPLNSGLRGDQMAGAVYGNGWDAEEYVVDVISTNMHFNNCTMTGNAKGGLLILTYGSANQSLHAIIGINGGSYDYGIGVAHDPYAITVTPYNFSISSTKLLLIQGVNLNGAEVGGRGVETFIVSDVTNIAAARALERTTLYATGDFNATAESASSIVRKYFAPDARTFDYVNNVMRLRSSASTMELQGEISNQVGGAFKISAMSYTERGALEFRMNLNTGGTDLYFSHSGSDKFCFKDSAMIPTVNYSLGGPGYSFQNIYLVNSPIVTSDANQKTLITDLSETEKQVARELKTLIKKYKMRQAVEDKDELARWHFGVIAQEVEATFTKFGLDAFEYGLLCKDEIKTEPESEVSCHYAIRYDELITFILSAM